MTEMTRRAMLGVGAAAMPLIATTAYKAAIAPMLPPIGIPPLASAGAGDLPHSAVQTVQERLDSAIATAAECLRELNAGPGVELLVERSNGWIFIGTRTPEKRVEWSGAGFYEIEQGKKRPIYWIERVDYKTKPGHYYRAISRWKGQDESKPFYIKADNLRIVRKHTDYAGRLRSSDLQA
ncbi:hypothetical protein N182_24735 [Sinorhizobium sp. GL2]|nr:hypothetical protein N182_24735 [Sinorhizobium sp. GL2]